MSKTYEIPMSPKYVAHWGIPEAGRELLANYNDSGRQKFLGMADDHTFKISNEIDQALSPSILILGESSKGVESAEIGQFGEGLKLAILCLLREGLSVVIENFDRKWEFEVAESELWEGEVVKITETPMEETGEFSVLISNVDTEIVNDLGEYQIERILEEEPNRQEIVGEHGRMIICGSGHGRTYVGGIYVMTNYSLPYILDLHPQSVELNRERSHIDIDTVFNRYKELVNKVIDEKDTPNRDAIIQDALRSGNFAERLVDSAEPSLEDPIYLLACEIKAKTTGKVVCRYTSELDVATNLGQGAVLLSSVEHQMLHKFFGEILQSQRFHAAVKVSPAEVLEPIIEYLEDKPEMERNLKVLKAHLPQWMSTL